jgi:hypothetical protein
MTTEYPRDHQAVIDLAKRGAERGLRSSTPSEGPPRVRTRASV